MPKTNDDDRSPRVDIHSRDDIDHDAEIRALERYGKPLEALEPKVRNRIKRNLWRNTIRDANRRKEITMTDPALRQTLVDYHERTYRENESTMNRRVDLKRAFDRLKDKYGEVICEAAAGIHTKAEAALMLHRRKSDVSELVDRANEEAVSLLLDYYPHLPPNLQRKYAEQYQERLRTAA